MTRLVLLGLAFLGSIASPLHAQPLPGTKPLEIEGDLARHMLDGIDRYLSREPAASVENAAEILEARLCSPQAYEKSIEPNRERLKKILGVVDARVPRRHPRGAAVDPDSDSLFDMLAKDGPFSLFPKPGRCEPLTQFAKENGITNGQINREQFARFVEFAQSQHA